MADEKVINILQIESSLLITLTNQGRLFQRHFDGAGYGDWHEMDLPDLKKSKPREAKQEGYSGDFERVWIGWTAKSKGSKQDAYKQYNSRIKEAGDCADLVHVKIVRGANEYMKFIEATTQYAMQVCRFLGKSKHYENDFTIPAQAIKKNKLKLPYGDNELESFAEKHKLRMARPGESSGAYRKYLQLEINQLSE